MSTPFVTGVLASLLSLSIVPNDPVAAGEYVKQLAPKVAKFSENSNSELMAKTPTGVLYTGIDEAQKKIVGSLRGYHEVANSALTSSPLPSLTFAISVVFSLYFFAG